jgi:hypothetical protein
MRKAASVQGALALGDAVGRLMAKEAFNPMPMLQNAGRAAMGFARANPQAAGALAGGALGAAGGAVAGGPNHRLSGALGGGLLGAGAGAFGGGTAARMQGGAMGFGDAASAQARSWAGKAQSVADRGGQLMQGTAPAPNMLHNRLQVG